MEALRIGIVTDRIWPFYEGGYERRYWNLAKWLSKKHEVHVLTSCPAVTKIGNIDFHKVAKRRSYFNESGYRILGEDLMYSLSLVKSISYRNKFDVLDCNGTPFLHVPLTVKICEIYGIEAFVTLHEVFKETLDAYFRQRGGVASSSYSSIASFLGMLHVSACIRLPKHLVSVSKVTARAIRSLYGREDVHVIPNGIDLEGIQSSLGNEHPSPCYASIAFVGRLSPEKRVEDLLELVCTLNRNGLRIKANIVGNGPLLGSLKEYSRKLRIDSNVVFHGHLSDREKIRILASSSVFLIPSSREGFSIAALEAMAVGLPVVGACPAHMESAGLLEILKPKHNGLIYPLDVRGAAARAVSRVLEDPVLWNRLSQGALSTARMYDWRHIVKDYESFLKEVCN